MARPEEIKYWLIVLMIRTTSSVRAAAQSGRFFLTAFCKLIILRALATRNPRRPPCRAGRNKVAADGGDDPDDVDKPDAKSASMIRKHFCSELVKEFLCVNTCFDVAHRFGVQFSIDPAYFTHDVQFIAEAARIPRCIMWPLCVCSSTNCLNSRLC